MCFADVYRSTRIAATGKTPGKLTATADKPQNKKKELYDVHVQLQGSKNVFLGV